MSIDERSKVIFDGVALRALPDVVAPALVHPPWIPHAVVPDGLTRDMADAFHAAALATAPPFHRLLNDQPGAILERAACISQPGDRCLTGSTLAELPVQPDADVDMTDSEAVAAKVTFQPQKISIRFTSGTNVGARVSSADRPTAPAKPNVLRNLIRRTPPARHTQPADDAHAAAAHVPPAERLQEQQDQAQQWRARTQPRFVSISQAAEEAGLPRNMVSIWCEQNLVRNIKPQHKNSRRVVDLSDVLRLVDQQVLPSLSRPSNGPCRCLLYVRMDPHADRTDEEDQQALAARVSTLEAIFLEQVRQPGWVASKGAEVGEAADFTRSGFVQLMAIILRRDIDKLVVTDDQQLCPAGCMPLLEWFCSHNHVTIVRMSSPEA